MRALLAKLSILKRKTRDTRGATAVEFALIAGPLIFLIFSCIELSLIIILSVTLDSATDRASRDIRTGIITSDNTTAEDFKQDVCDGMGWLGVDCMSRLHLEVQTYDNFAGVPLTDPIKNGKFDPIILPYAIGGGSKIQMVRAYYEWTLFTPFLNDGLSSLSNKNAVVSAKVIFRNEPF